jgi:hypothetical protein
MTKRNRRTTPHAPCTPNWIQKAPAERPPKEEGKIHRGIKALENIYINMRPYN